MNNLKSYSTWTTALSINSCYTIIHTYFAKLCEEKKEEGEEDEDEEDEEEENKKEEEYKEEDEDEEGEGKYLHATWTSVLLCSSAPTLFLTMQR